MARKSLEEKISSYSCRGNRLLCGDPVRGKFGPIFCHKLGSRFLNLLFLKDISFSIVQHSTATQLETQQQNLKKKIMITSITEYLEDLKEAFIPTVAKAEDEVCFF